MSKLTIFGSDPTAHILRIACEANGLESVTQVASSYSPLVPATILSANISRVITAVRAEEELKDLSAIPDRKIIRLARSGYIISEIPLGRFYSDRYGSSLYNLAEHDLMTLLSNQQPEITKNFEETYEKRTDILAVTGATNLKTSNSDQFKTYYAEIPFEEKKSRVNTSWIGSQQVAYQFSTKRTSHVIFLLLSDRRLDPEDWHPTIREAAHSAALRAQNNQHPAPTSPLLTDSPSVHLGDAWFEGDWLIPESVHIGIEDAWVLSRMIENYEEDVSSAISSYNKFRTTRLARLRRSKGQEFDIYFKQEGFSKLSQYIRMAFSTRFIPEIYMHSQDWFHGYDCLRGFR